jgi:hypothetical protein
MEKLQVQKIVKKLQMYRVSHSSLILITPPLMEINKNLNPSPKDGHQMFINKAHTSKRHIYKNFIIPIHAFSN